MSRSIHIEAAGRSHPGKRRRNNEDSFAVDPEIGLFVVADGIGGNAAGEVASAMAVETVQELIGEAVRDDIEDRTSLGWARLMMAVQSANRRIFAHAERSPMTYGMGTTITGALACGTELAIAHVGDSRAYLLRAGELSVLTEDHSFFNECVQTGRLSPELAALHPQRDALTRALGSNGMVDVDMRTIEPESGDVLLLCSDGLSGVVEEREIAAMLLVHRDPDEAADQLVQRANEMGGPDNVTVIVVRWA